MDRRVALTLATGFTSAVVVCFALFAEAPQGCVKGDCINGPGERVFPDGNRLIVSFKKGMPEGQGKIQYADGGTYEGTFVAGKQQGYGTRNWPGQALYRGQWLQGRIHGQGSIRFASGTT
ncbi:MAG TPA: hypothetical protein PLW55_16580, partial [Leptospiraceae bacterium]|nr:hypothetical protein [Leptospiraceae bacterium]